MRKRIGRRVPPVRPSRANELWYRAELGRLVRILVAAAHEVLPSSLRSVWPAVHDAAPVDDAIARLARKFGGIDALAKRLAHGAALRNLHETDRRISQSIHASVGVDVSGMLTGTSKIAAKMQEFERWNVSLIRSIPEEFLGKVGAAVGEAWESGRRWEDIAGIISDIGDVTDSRARLIARDQTAKMNSSFARLRMTDLGITRYIWQTSDDERVRESHAEVDGQEFSFDEPGPVAGSIDGAPCHPGDDCQCRCVALPSVNVDVQEAEQAESIAA